MNVVLFLNLQPTREIRQGAILSVFHIELNSDKTASLHFNIFIPLKNMLYCVIHNMYLWNMIVRLDVFLTQLFKVLLFACISQWECKTDMDNAYRFGTVEVTCEGYGYPDDPYVLRGSCGVRNIDWLCLVVCFLLIILLIVLYKIWMMVYNIKYSS